MARTRLWMTKNTGLNSVCKIRKKTFQIKDSDLDAVFRPEPSGSPKTSLWKRDCSKSSAKFMNHIQPQLLVGHKCILWPKKYRPILGGVIQWNNLNLPELYWHDSKVNSKLNKNACCPIRELAFDKLCCTMLIFVNFPLIFILWSVKIVPFNELFGVCCTKQIFANSSGSSFLFCSLAGISRFSQMNLIFQWNEITF